MFVAAKVQRIPLRRDAAEADVHSSRRRLRVRSLEGKEDIDRRPLWALPGTWDEEGFRRVSSSGEPASALR